MFNSKGFVGFLSVVLLSGLVVACGSTTTPADVVVDNGVADVSTDVVEEVVADVVADVAPEVVADVTSDAVADTAVLDTVEDVPVDVPTTIQIDGGFAPIVDDPYKDILPKDVDWASLPTMPSGKIFTTKYAAGVGVASITPDWVTYLGGYGNCAANDINCHKTDLVHDPLEARAVAIADTDSGVISVFVGIDTIGLVDVDIVGIHRTIQKTMYETFNIYFEGANAILAPSHSHSSMDTMGLWGPMMGAGRDEKYLKLVFDGVAEAARLAVADLQDVDMVRAVAEYAENYGEDPDGNLDSKIWVLKGTVPEGGETVFTLTRWAAHPTTYGFGDRVMSADYLGTFRLKMEQELGGKAVYLNGPIGSVYPNRPEECGLAEEAFPEGDRTPGDESSNVYMQATCTGFGLADATLAALETAQPLADTGVEVMHKMFYFHPYNDFLMFALENIPLPMPGCYSEDYACHIWARMSLVKLGDLTYVTTPGEAFPTFARNMEMVIAEAELPNPVVIGLGQGWMGYLMTEEHFSDSKNGLDYNKGLCPGPDLDPKILIALRTMLGLPVAE
jgi:hypothetical protein